jgi:hypothetical protein
VKGNLLTAVSIPAISASARKLGVPVRIFYSSNADDIWEIKEQYRRNLLGLPLDERSVLLRTVYPRPRRQDRPWNWIYVVHDGIEARRLLARPGWSWTHYFDDDKEPGTPDGLVAIGLPARTEREPAPAP